MAVAPVRQGVKCSPGRTRACTRQWALERGKLRELFALPLGAVLSFARKWNFTEGVHVLVHRAYIVPRPAATRRCSPS